MTIYDVLKQLAKTITDILESYDPYGFRDSMNLEDDYQTAIDETYSYLIDKDTCIIDTLTEIAKTYIEDGENDLSHSVLLTLGFVETMYKEYEY